MAEARMPEGRGAAGGRRAKAAGVVSAPTATNASLRPVISIPLPEALKAPPPSDSLESLGSSPLGSTLHEPHSEWFLQDEQERVGDEPAQLDVVWSPIEIAGVEYLTLSDSELAAIGGLP